MKNLFLLHGWNYANYTKFNGKDAWANREIFVKELSKHFNVIKLNLPGFCGQQEPSAAWNLENYADYFEHFIKQTGLIPHFVLGYSFGGAVAVKWKLKYRGYSKLILVSPAIIRAYEKRKETTFISKIKKMVPNWISNKFRHYYLKYFIKNKFYIHGTKFLRGSYLSIVKVDLSKDILELDEKGVLCIFGENDTATPPNKLREKFGNNSLINRIRVIHNGGHDIANTHSQIILKHILEDEN